MRHLCRHWPCWCFDLFSPSVLKPPVTLRHPVRQPPSITSGSQAWTWTRRTSQGCDELQHQSRELMEGKESTMMRSHSWASHLVRGSSVQMISELLFPMEQRFFVMLMKINHLSAAVPLLSVQLQYNEHFVLYHFIICLLFTIWSNFLSILTHCWDCVWVVIICEFNLIRNFTSSILLGFVAHKQRSWGGDITSGFGKFFITLRQFKDQNNLIQDQMFNWWLINEVNIW